MNGKRTSFLIGVLISVSFLAVVSDMRVLDAISRKVSFQKLPYELRMGIDLGILDFDDVVKHRLQVPVTRREFGVILKKVLQMLGAPAGSELSDISASGIFSTSPAGKALSRRQAVEAACRAIIHLADSELITLPAGTAEGFADFPVAPKIQAPFKVLRQAGIVKGYPDGRLHGERAISRQETVFLLFRLYEHASNALKTRRTEKGISFLDLPFDHPVMDTIRFLERAGGFDQVQLKPCFDGYSIISERQVADIIKGILVKHGREAEQASIDQLLDAENPIQSANRGWFALALKILAEPYLPTTDGHGNGEFYKDVDRSSPQFQAVDFLARKGIYLGYPTGNLHGDEGVTWFEAVGVLNAMLIQFDIDRPDSEKEESLQKSDLDSFIAILKAKKARIRRILDRPPTVRGK